MQPDPAYVVATQPEESARPRLLLVEPGRAVPVRDLDEPEGWHDPANRVEAERHLLKLERDLDAGKRRRAARARRRLLACIHRDRLARASSIAERAWLPLERVGAGPGLDVADVHRHLRRTWRVFPLTSDPATTPPGPAARAKAAWDAHGPVFDRFYLAYEIEGSVDVLNGAATPCLIGVISSDGVTGDWFVLDRWTI